MSQVIIIDGKNFAYRHGWTHRGLGIKNQPTGMLYGAISGMLRLARLHPGAIFVVCWDGDNERKSWRHRLAPNYKANRGQKDAPQFVKDLRSQIPLFVEFLNLLGYKQFRVPQIEADDLIGLLSNHIRRMCESVIIYSTDRDFYQLIRKNVQVVRDQDKTKECRPITAKEIFAEFGVSPSDWLRYRGLVGDAGDNIIKPKGMGPAKALKLLANGVDVTTDIASSMLTGKELALCKLNAELSRIIIDPEDKVFNAKEKKEVKKFLRQIKCVGDMERTGKKKEVYTAMLKFLARYEFEELMNRRKELWALF